MKPTNNTYAALEGIQSLILFSSLLKSSAKILYVLKREIGRMPDLNEVKLRTSWQLLDTSSSASTAIHSCTAATLCPSSIIAAFKASPPSCLAFFCSLFLCSVCIKELPSLFQYKHVFVISIFTCSIPLTIKVTSHALPHQLG